MLNIKYVYFDETNMYSLVKCAKMFNMSFVDFITFMCTIGVGYYNKKKNCFIPYRRYTRFKGGRKPFFVIKHLSEDVRISYVTKEGVKYMKTFL